MIGKAIAGCGLAILAGIVVFALVQAATPTAGPKLVPTCEDNAALRVQVQRTAQLWLVCYYAHDNRILAEPESNAGALPN